MYVVWGLDGPTFLGVYMPHELHAAFLVEESCPVGVLWMEPLEAPLRRELTVQDYIDCAAFCARVAGKFLAAQSNPTITE